MAANTSIVDKNTAFDHEIFKSVPPEKPELITTLFCGRETEVEATLATLRAHADIRGIRSSQCDKRPWIIHGESRCGKSHLARRVAMEFEDSGKRRRIIVSSRDRIDAVRVMTDVFARVLDLFVSLTRDRPQEEQGKQAMLNLTKDIALRVKQLVGMAQSVTVTITKDQRKKLQAGFSVANFPKVVEFCIGYGTETGKGESLAVTLGPPTAEDLAKHCGLMIDALFNVGLLEHLLILVDDVDLIDRAPYTDISRRRQCSELSGALMTLHRIPGVDVIITARTWYAYSNREFNTLLDLSLCPPMDTDDLLEIHNRRMQAFCRRAGVKQFLTDEALQRAAGLANGLPGLWLRYLEKAFELYLMDPSWEEKGWNWLMEVFVRTFTAYRPIHVEAASALQKAVLDKIEVIDADKITVYSGTPYDEIFWIECYSKEQRLALTPLAFAVIKRLADTTRHD